MAETLGRPFAYLSLGLAAWVGGRLYWNEADGDRIAAAATLIATEAQPRQIVVKSDQSTVKTAIIPSHPTAGGQRLHPRISGLTPALLDPWQDGGRPSGLSIAPRVAESDKPLSTGRDTPPTNALAPVGKAGTHPIKRRWGGEVYAYSFWRVTTGGDPALAPGAQYGGSQSGLIATVDPFGDPNRGLSLLLRGSATPDGDEREMALGARWKPDANWPLELSVERRFRANGPDRFAAYLAGGVDALPLAGKLRFNAYGQAGYASGRGGGGFFDWQARAMHPLGGIAGAPISVGAGSWAGGQRGASRLDLGPTIAAKIDTGPAALLIQLDWRLRVAGNARPQDGVALTVSTGF